MIVMAFLSQGSVMISNGNPQHGGLNVMIKIHRKGPERQYSKSITKQYVAIMEFFLQGGGVSGVMILMEVCSWGDSYKTHHIMILSTDALYAKPYK